MLHKNNSSKSKPNFRRFAAVDTIKVGNDAIGADHRQSRYVTNDEFGLRWQSKAATPLSWALTDHQTRSVVQTHFRRHPACHAVLSDIASATAEDLTKADGQKHPQFPPNEPNL
jgi:hypothetical protein